MRSCPSAGYQSLYRLMLLEQCHNTKTPDLLTWEWKPCSKRGSGFRPSSHELERCRITFSRVISLWAILWTCNAEDISTAVHVKQCTLFPQQLPRPNGFKLIHWKKKPSAFCTARLQLICAGAGAEGKRSLFSSFINFYKDTKAWLCECVI